MKYIRGYLVAAIIGAVTWAFMALGDRFTTLVDMVYPYVTRTLQNMLAQWSSGVDFCLWQVALVLLGVVVLASVLLIITAQRSHSLTESSRRSRRLRTTAHMMLLL